MKTNQKLIFVLVTALALLVQLMNPTLVHADGEPPTAPAEPATEAAPAKAPVVKGASAAPAEPATNAAPADAPVVKSASSAPAEPATNAAPADAPAATDATLVPADSATEVAPVETPLATEAPAQAESNSAGDRSTVAPVDPSPSPTEAAATETPTLGEVLQEIPAGTDVVVLDETGQPLTLASQAAAEIVGSGDPIWCPTGVVPNPGVGGCTDSYVNLSDLVTSFVPTGNGTIWIQNVSDTGSAVAIDGTGTWSSAANYNLTLQGGWTLAHTLNGISGTSTFDTPISITNWNAPVTVNNLTIQNVSGTGLTVGTTGDITVNTLTASGNEANTIDHYFNSDCVSYGNYYGGACLDNTSGGGDVILSNLIFNNNKKRGLGVYSNGNVVFNNVTANNNGLENGLEGAAVNAYQGEINIIDSHFDNNGGVGLGLNNNFGNNNKDVSITGGTYNHNAAGMHIQATGSLTLTNVTASNNTRNLGGGPSVWGDGILAKSFYGNIIVKGGNFSGNQYNGLLLNAPEGSVTITGVTSSGNTMGDIFVGVAKSVTISKSDANTTILVVPTIKMAPGQNDVGFALDCLHQKNYPVELPNGDRVKIICPVTGYTHITRLDNTTLPADLPAGYSYVAAFGLDILQQDKPINVIDENGKIDLSFNIAALQPGYAYSILYWDAAAGKWIQLKDFMFDGQGQPRVFDLHPGDPADLRKLFSGVNFVSSADGSHVEASANFPGIFVLVQH